MKNIAIYLSGNYAEILRYLSDFLEEFNFFRLSLFIIVNKSAVLCIEFYNLIIFLKTAILPFIFCHVIEYFESNTFHKIYLGKYELEKLIKKQLLCTNSE